MSGPIAWVRNPGETLIHRDEDCGLFERRYYNGHPVRVLDTLPNDAVPLVPATEVEKLQAHVDGADALVQRAQGIAERAEERADDFEGRYESAHASRMHAERVVVRLESEVERLKAAPQLPALDTPEALRYAADVVQAHWAKRTQRVVSDTDAMVTANSLRHLANIAEVAARADAEREARIEKLAEYEYGVWRTINADFSDRPEWCDADATVRNPWLAWANYRLDPTQAKP